MRMNLNGYEVFILQIQEIESSSRAHQDLLNWAAWGLQDDFAPRLAIPAVWDMPGAPDPDRDTEAPPEVPPVPVNEKRALEIDKRIHDPEFPAIWRKVLSVHYLPPKYRNGHRCQNALPIWQRPQAARCSMDTYLEQLRNALERLE